MINQIFISLILLASLSTQAQSSDVPLCDADQMKICNGCASSASYCCISGIAKRGCSANPTVWEKSKACSRQCKIAPVVKTPIIPKIDEPKITPIIDMPKVEIPTDESKIEPVKEPIDKNTGAFPADGESLSIQFKNSTAIPIIVWLDNQAFCPKKSSVADCKQGDNSAWDKNLGKFFIYTKKDGQWILEAGKSGRKQTIEPGQVWRIVPPLDEKNRPYWCFDQPAGKGWKRNCPGVGAWVTPTGINMNAIEKVTRFEYNINGNEIWFNQSAVDGSNINATTEYTGNCPDNKRICKLDLNSCPVIGKADGALTCFSPKFWQDTDKCGTNGFGTKWKLSPRDLAGCGYGDREHKIECHKWWATNPCAQSWLKYLQDDGKCQTYGWAYDEMRWDESQGDNFDFNGNPQHNKVVRPLINCPLKLGTSLNIDITDILR